LIVLRKGIPAICFVSTTHTPTHCRLFYSPLASIDWHNENPVFDPFEDYYWKGRGMGMGREEENLDIEAYCPGIDCAVNCSEYIYDGANTQMQ
jgi:hypothetical protein